MATNITIIGAGNIGGAVVRGWSKSGAELNITVSGRHMEKLERVKADCPDINISTDNVASTKSADIVVIAVKPWQVQDVVNQIKPNFRKDMILVSFAAGITTGQLKEMITECEFPQVFYVMPNIAAEFCESMTFVCASAGTEPSYINKVEELFKLDGRVMVCEEKLINPGMLIASCGIAYIMRILRVQTQAGVEMGFYPNDALNLALQTMQGAVSLLRGTGEHPEKAIDRVTTPGGYTIKGLNEMDHAGLASAIIRVFKTGL